MFSLPIDSELKLALLGPEYAARLFELVLAQRDDLSQFLSWPGLVQQQEDSLQYLSQALSDYGKGHSLTCGLLLDNELVGMIDLRGLDARRVGILGYWLARPYRGRGIVTRAARGLMAYGFNQLALEKVELRCAVQNARSCAVASRLGMVHEGTLRRSEVINGQCLDHHVFGLLKSEWQRHNASGI